jgi:hypothetical protein
MKYPAFYDQVETIVARLAGHFCPTVAGAYLMVARGVKAPFENELLLRGEIAVVMQQNQHEGVCGVIANVFSYITGATESSGFHDLADQFDRRQLLSFGHQIPAQAQFTRKSNGRSVLVSYDPGCVPADPDMRPLLSKAISGQADAGQELRFRQLWQSRVESILCDYANGPRLLMIEPVQG